MLTRALRSTQPIGDNIVFPPSNPPRAQFIANLLGKLSELGTTLDIEFITAKCTHLGSVYWSKILIPTPETWQNVKEEAKRRLSKIEDPIKDPEKMDAILASEDPRSIRDLGNRRQKILWEYEGRRLQTTLSTALLFENVWIGANSLAALVQSVDHDVESLRQVHAKCLVREKSDIRRLT